MTVKVHSDPIYHLCHKCDAPIYCNEENEFACDIRCDDCKEAK